MLEEERGQGLEKEMGYMAAVVLAGGIGGVEAEMEKEEEGDSGGRKRAREDKMAGAGMG